MSSSSLQASESHQVEQSTDYRLIKARCVIVGVLRAHVQDRIMIEYRSTVGAQMVATQKHP